MNEAESKYLCVGICLPDPKTGTCQGCGRPRDFWLEDLAPGEAPPAANADDNSETAATDPA